jgi:phospholipid transport system substrate-binding protein
MSRLSFGVLFAALVFSLSATAATRAADPAELIQSVGSEVTGIVQIKAGTTREEAMRNLLHRDFDLAHVARSALGEHWSEASEPLQARILAAFEATEAKSYVDRLASFQSVTVNGVTARTAGVWMVSTTLNLSGGEAMKVDWEVRQSGADLRISDVKVAGVSLFTAQRASFRSYVALHGGQVEPLVQVLEARAAR